MTQPQVSRCQSQWVPHSSVSCSWKKFPSTILPKKPRVGMGFAILGNSRQTHRTFLRPRSRHTSSGPAGEALENLPVAPPLQHTAAVLMPTSHIGPFPRISSPCRREPAEVELPDRPRCRDPCHPRAPSACQGRPSAESASLGQASKDAAAGPTLRPFSGPRGHGMEGGFSPTVLTQIRPTRNAPPPPQLQRIRGQGRIQPYRCRKFRRTCKPRGTAGLPPGTNLLSR